MLRNEKKLKECIEQYSLGFSIFKSHELQCRESEKVMSQVAQLLSSRWQAYREIKDIKLANEDISFLKK